jgi:hypothetical protein
MWAIGFSDVIGCNDSEFSNTFYVSITKKWNKY